MKSLQIQLILVGAFTSFLSLVNCEPSEIQAIVGESCDNNTACSVKGSVCNITNGTRICECVSGMPSADNYKCFSRLGDLCTGNEDCTNGAYCKRGPDVCGCLIDYIESPDLTKCLPIINKINDGICEEHMQCRNGQPGSHSSCVLKADGSGKACRCNDGALHDDTLQHPDTRNNKCYLKANKVGDHCEIEKQCLEMSSHCANSICKCNLDDVVAPDLSSCLKKKFLNETCSLRVECEHIEHALCSFANPSASTGVCKCSPDYISPAEVNACYKMASVIGESCELDIQCKFTDYSFCNKTIGGSLAKCDCIANHTESTDKTACLPIVTTLRTNCSDNTQCQIDNSECVPGANVCDCIPEEFVESNKTAGQCIEIIKERNKNCTEDIQCKEGLGSRATCDSGSCQCNPFSGYYNGKCYNPSKLDEPCHVVEECYAGVNNLTYCSFTNNDTDHKRCRCVPGAIPFNNNEKCFATDIKIGSRCEDDSVCSVIIAGNALCDLTTRTCACGIGSTPTAGGSICASGAFSVHQYHYFLVQVLLIIILFVK